MILRYVINILGISIVMVGDLLRLFGYKLMSGDVARELYTSADETFTKVIFGGAK